MDLVFSSGLDFAPAILILKYTITKVVKHYTTQIVTSSFDDHLHIPFPLSAFRFHFPFPPFTVAPISSVWTWWLEVPSKLASFSLICANQQCCGYKRAVLSNLRGIHAFSGNNIHLSHLAYCVCSIWYVCSSFFSCPQPTCVHTSNSHSQVPCDHSEFDITASKLRTQTSLEFIINLLVIITVIMSIGYMISTLLWDGDISLKLV